MNRIERPRPASLSRSGAPQRRAAAGLAALVLASGALVGQADPRTRDLATGDPVATEAARRRLCAGPATAVPVEVLVRLLRSADPFRRRAAASVLLAHGLGGEALEAWWGEEIDPRAIEALVEHLPRAAAERLVRIDPPAPADAEDPRLDDDLALRLRGRALGRLLDTGGVPPETWRRVLAAARPGFARAAADRLVEEAVPFPVELLDRLDPSSQSLLLGALADRPRIEAAPFAAALLEAGGLSAHDELRALLALPAADWPRARVRALPAALLEADRELRSLASRACALLPEAEAERLVADIHRRAVAGQPVADLLPALVRIGARGERLLLGLARDLPEDERAAIVDWLTGRGSAIVDEIVADALDGRYPLTAALLRRAGASMTSPPRLRAALDLIEDPDAAPELRVAAFGALVDRGALEPGMLAFALEADGDPRSRVRLLLSMPLDALGAEAWRTLLAQAPHDVVQEVMARMAEVPVQRGLEDDLLALAAEGVGLGDLAARVCLIAGREPLARQVWDGLSAERQGHLALALCQRRGDWVLEALRRTPREDGKFELPYARLVAGDRQIVDEILADPGSWPLRWLRRGDEPARALLRSEDLDLLRRAILDPGLDADHRRELVRWLGAAPDLGGEALLAEVHADDPDEEVRYAALRGLLARPAAAARFRAVLAARLGFAPDGSPPRGLDLDSRELAFEVIGSLRPPVDAEAALLVARLALVAPLAHPEHELRVALGLEPIADAALLNAVWQAVGREVAPGLGAALATAAAEASSHPDALLSARHRLGRFLALLVRTEETRPSAAPIAALILGLPDLDPGFVGPASVILAEAAEAASDWSGAAEHWERAARGCLRTPPEPLLLRPFVGDAWRAEGRLPAAYLAARPHLCRARAALGHGEPEAARRHLEQARTLGQGDRDTLEELTRIEQEMPR
jgi:hypothetical protein